MTFVDIARAEVGQLARRQSELEARRRDLGRPAPDISDLADIAERFNGAYASVGAARAPAPLPGESRFSYRRRLAGGLQHFADDWRHSDLYKLPGDALDAAESAILAATEAAVADKTRGDPRTGGLREIRRADRSGRQVVDFAGPPLSWMQAFMSPAKAVRAFRNPSTGASLRTGRRTIG
jgi:hypothetical protein